VSATASNPRRPTYVTVRQAAWLLGVSNSVVHRAIRVGTLRAVWRRSRLVVAEADLRQLMPGGAA
jgi:excisionase family DNA binding protein